MAAEGPLSIEAPKPVVNENEHAPAIRPVPGPLSNGPDDAQTQQPTATSWFNAGKQKIGSSAEVIVAGEQQTQHKSIETETVIQNLGPDGTLVANSSTLTETKVGQQSIFLLDNQGNMRVFVRIIIEQRKIQVTQISQVLYHEVRIAKEIQERKGKDKESVTCKEKAFDCCCQSLVCHFSNIKSKEDSVVQKNQVMTTTLRRARTKGYTILKGIVYPFVSDIARDFWVFFLLVFFLIQVSLSASIFILSYAENYQPSHLAHLCVSGLAVFLVTIDFIFNFTQCNTCKACISCCRERANRARQREYNIENQPADKNKIENGAEASNANVDEEAAKGSANLREDLENRNSHKDKSKCRKCFEGSRSRLDIARLFLTEFILVPMIICDMFEVATGKGFNSDVVHHRIGFALMLYDSIGLIFFVFILRLVILGRMIYSEQKVHLTPKEIQKMLNPPTAKDAKTNDDPNKQGTAEDANTNDDPNKQGRTEDAKTKNDSNEICEHFQTEYGIDGNIKRNSLAILILLFLHVLTQTIAHALMLVALGAKVAYDTRNYGTPITEYRYVEGFGTVSEVVSDTRILFSSYFMYMTMAVYVLPTIGFGIFFLVYNFWIQELLVGLCIDFVKLLRICEDVNAIQWEGKRRSEVIGNFVGMNFNNQGQDQDLDLLQEYKNMRKTNIFIKIGYPFRSPFSVIICIVYAVSQFAFILCCIHTLDTTDNRSVRTELVYLNGGGWYEYVIVASIFGAIVNIYSFLIAALWIVGLAVLAVGVPLIAVAACCIFMCKANDWLNDTS